jgi:hypothetical protein
MLARLARRWEFESPLGHQFKKENMNAAHKIGRLKNRLSRLKRVEKTAPTDRKMMMNSRIQEIEEILRANKR